ncbi:MAG: type II toxin-antitoxin system HicB family antitoxin [Proteobacteria bacterium]|jgi:predicted RNase H-like HicB family nuclease|nr:type II toxin-antitoxin system HicB family antitoxin [Pseudomonadota bacterium]
MKFYNFEVVIEKEPDGVGYLAYSPTLPGCFSNGLTVEEAKRNIREAVQQHLAALLDKGEAIPQFERIVHVEEISVGMPA